MKKIVYALGLTALLSGCAGITPPLSIEEPIIVKNELKEFNTLPPPAGGPIVAAVYGFSDKTGQRKPSEKLANISFAVTQGAEVYVIKALQEVGQGAWFKVVERVGLDNLTKERQIIRQARESVGDQRQLKPMMFAGVLIEGAIVGYDSNTLTGGAGARWLGIGLSTQYRQDVVTVNIRAISVQTGEVLISSTVTKSIISVGNSTSVFKFFDQGTSSFESEIGYSTNEPVNYAVRVAIEQAVVDLIKEGSKKGFWAFKKDEPVKASAAPEVAKPVEVKENKNESVQENSSSKAETPVAAKPQEIKETKNELVQKNTAPETAPQAAPAPQQSDSRQNNETNSQQPKTTDSNRQKGKVIDWSNLRASQEQSSDRILNMRPGTMVEIIKADKDFYYARVGEKEGWIRKKFIKVQK